MVEAAGKRICGWWRSRKALSFREPQRGWSSRQAIRASPISGGVVQGIGTAMYERYVYDSDGNLLTQSYMDYLIPTSMESPEFTIGHQETPSPYTPHGIKGGGEGGRMMAPAAVSAAIDDALAPLGVRANAVPASPARIVKWIEEAGRGS